MRTLNVRLVVILLASGGAGALAITALHGYQVRRNAGVLLEEAEGARQRAEEAEEKGDRQAQQEELLGALRNYLAYLRLVPGDTDALQDLGFLLADLSQYGAAFERLEELLRRDPNRTEARRKLVDVLMAMGRRLFPDAKVHLEYLLKDSPDDAELLELLGKCQRVTGEVDAAKESFQRAIDIAPDRLEAYCGLAAILRRDSGPSGKEQADQYMAKMAEANPESHKAHLLYGAYLHDIGKWDEAMAEALKALELEPEDPDALSLAAVCALRKKDYDKARGYAQDGIEKHPKYFRLYIILANVELRVGREEAEPEKTPDEEPEKTPDEEPEKTPEGEPEKTPDEEPEAAPGQQRQRSPQEAREAREKAMAWLRKGLKATDNHPELLWMLASRLIDAREFEEANKITDQLAASTQRASFPRTRPLAGFLRARIKFAQGDWLAACEGFAKLRGSLDALPDLQKRVDYLQGLCYRALGNTDQELAAFRRALAIDPFYARARQGLASALSRSGQLGEAINELRSALGQNQSSRGWLLELAQMLIRRNALQSPAERDWEEVKEVLDQAAKANPRSARVPMYQAEVLVTQDRIEEAEKLLLDARDKNPENIALRTMLASLAVRKKDWVQTERILEAAREKLGDKVELRFARAQYLARRYGNEAADRLKEMVNNTESFSQQDRLRLWKGLLITAQQVGDDELIKSLCRRVAKRETNNVRVWFLLFGVALRADDNPGVKESLEQIRRIEAEGPFWLYGQAARLRVQAGRLILQAKTEKDRKLLDRAEKLLDQAEQYLDGALESRSTWSELLLLAGGIYGLQGNIYDQQGKKEQAQRKNQQALETYRRTIEMGVKSPGAIRSTVRLLLQGQRYAEAAKLLEDLEEREVPLSPELVRLWAQQDIRGGNFARAEKHAREAVAEDPNDYGNHIWLGQVVGTLGIRRRDEAQKVKREAERMLAEAEKRKEEAEKMLAQPEQRKPEAERMLAEAKQALRRAKQEAENMLAEAENRDKEARKMFDEAKESFRRAVAMAGETPETWVALIRFLVETQQTQAAEEAIARARGKIPSDQAPLALAQCYDAVAQGYNVLARQMKALAQWYNALAQRTKDPAQRMEAQNKYNEFLKVAQNKSNKYERYRMEAENQYNKALAAAPDDPVVVRSAADFYLRNNRPETAAAYLGRITNGKVEARQSDLIWARRTLAGILYDRGLFQDLQKAEALLEENLAVARSSAQDLRLWCRFCLNDPRRRKREQAIQAMSNFQATTPEDLFLQARLCSAQGDWVRAGSLMQRLLASHGNSPRYLAWYVNELLGHNEIQEAEMYLGRLEQIAAGEFRTINLKAEVMFKRMEFDQLLEMLTAVVDKGSVGSADQAARRGLVGQSLDRFALRLKTPANEPPFVARFDGDAEKAELFCKPFAARFAQKAESFYRQYIEQRPAESLVLVGFLGRHGRIEEALNLFERALTSGNPVRLAKGAFIHQFANTGRILVKSPEATKEQVARGARILQAALDKCEGAAVPLLLVMADARTNQERYSEAEASYRKIIKKYGPNALAMNNLAVLLALQGKSLDDALRMINRAIEIAGPEASMLDSRATVYMALGQSDRALAELDRAIAEKRTPVRLLHRAQARLQAGSRQAAAKDIKEANDLGLKRENLQPLERPIYDKLQALLE